MIAKLLDDAVNGQRLTPEQGLELLKSNDLAGLGAAANAVTLRKHPEAYRTYNIDRNINYTNCLLYTSPSPRDATLSRMPSSA